MKALLNKYKHATTFSLTGPFQKGYHKEHPYGIYTLDAPTANNALKDVYSRIITQLRSRYSNWPVNEIKLHPSFDDLIEGIQEEVINHSNRLLNHKLKTNESPFMCDVFIQGNANHKEPLDLWHFYHDISLFEDTYKPTINALKQNKIKRDIDDIFEIPYYAPLQPCLINTKISFFWHCTQSSQLAITYFFQLNPLSIRWLEQRENEFDMQELEDLAFYKDDKLLFSSCTHEMYQVDVENTLK